MTIFQFFFSVTQVFRQFFDLYALNQETHRNYSRSSCDLNAANSILEAVRPQARNILITHFHLATIKVCTLIQANLVILWVLEKNAI